MSSSVIETAKPAIVLVSPKGPDNIGSTARAMKNFGLSDLRIVQPRCRLEQARMMASHAQDVLENAKVFETLLEAVGECELVVATTARDRRDHTPPISPREVAALFVTQAASSSAVVFGREEHGLYNDELDLCHVHVRIPAEGDYVSLNLAQAVQVIVYELSLARQFGPIIVSGSSTGTVQHPIPVKQTLPNARIASRAMLDAMYKHLAELMLEVGYTDEKREDHMLRRFRQFMDRAAMTEYDVNVFRGLLKQGLWASRKARGLGIPGSMPWPKVEDSEHSLESDSEHSLEPNLEPNLEKGSA
jgi:tRNA/rRNA methyltransferase